jgi:hypothetical protein
MKSENGPALINFARGAIQINDLSSPVKQVTEELAFHMDS